MMRRLRLTHPFALVAFLALAIGSQLEPILGALRDGVVHHESVAQADMHRAADVFGDHGHEDGAARSSEHRHGAQHEHGSGTDHCTHAHGAGLPAAVEPAVDVMVSSIESAPVHLPSTRIIEAHSPPPRV